MELLAKYLERVAEFVSEHAMVRCVLTVIIFMIAVQLVGLVHLDAHVDVARTKSQVPATSDGAPPRTRRDEYSCKCHVRATKFCPVAEVQTNVGL